MKYASAMKYGGELVAAIDCDYNSFKEMVPLCPNCKEPVYLRSGGQRESVKGKAYQIGPHWCHFKGISAEQVSGCELRVNGYTEKDRAKIAAQARGQRLRLLQRWFWRVFSTYLVPLPIQAFTPDDYSNKNRDHSEAMIKEVFEAMIKEVKAALMGGRAIIRPFPYSSRWPDPGYSIQRMPMPPTMQESQISVVAQEYCEDPIDQLVGIPICQSLIKFWQNDANCHRTYDEKGYTAIVDLSPSLPTSCNDLLQLKLCNEVHDFLAAKNSQSLLVDSFARVLTLCDYSPETAAAASLLPEVHPHVIMSFILQHAIAAVPWASEFQRLEAEAKQRKDAA
jgi:hypothetical protein